MPVSQPANRTKKRNLTVPDVETAPNPCFGEEGPFPLLCSMKIEKEMIEFHGHNVILPPGRLTSAQVEREHIRLYLERLTFFPVKVQCVNSRGCPLTFYLIRMERANSLA